MAYVHCHRCGWSQDDFWEFKISWNSRYRGMQKLQFGYSPLRNIWDALEIYGKPRWLNFGYEVIDEDGDKVRWRSEVVHIPEDEITDRMHGEVSSGNGCDVNRYYIWSWSILWLNIKGEARKMWKQKWWTYKQYMKDKDVAVCPTCGSDKLDID